MTDELQSLFKGILSHGLTVIDNLTDEQLKETFKCPTCSGYIPNNEDIGAYSGALSRHGHGEICSACGTREALTDYFGVKDNDNIVFIVSE
jgi:hypothetical protein